MNGCMAEAENGVAILDDVHEGTFIRFLQFAYTDDYSAPLCLISNDHVSDDEIHSDNPFDSLAVERKTTDTWGRQNEDAEPGFEETFWEFFISPLLHSDLHNECKARSNQDPSEDYSPVFLGHASVYAFADKYNVKTLKILALQKLHQTLRVFTLYPCRVSDILELVRYCYENTPDCEHSQDDLRRLLCQYVACKYDVMIRSKDVLGFVEGGGPFVSDLMVMLARRMEA